MVLQMVNKAGKTECFYDRVESARGEIKMSFFFFFLPRSSYCCYLTDHLICSVGQSHMIYLGDTSMFLSA